MSQAKKKSKGKKQAAKQDATLQELQANIDSMSLVEAMAAVKNAKEMVRKLKQEQEDAARAIQTTRDELQNKTINKEKSEYSAASFWEQRYAAESSNVADTSFQYEWYMSYATFGPIVSPALRVAMATHPDKAVVVAGCGNSMLCEDLYRAGYTNIMGVDYAPSVINSKYQQAKKLGYNIQYLQADMCSMVQIASESVAAVVDKGTLDAIVSADKDQASASFQRALQYLSECFRVLLLKGQFLLLSTIPPHMLRELLQPLQLTVTTSSNHVTDAGRDIYYYSLVKATTKLTTPKLDDNPLPGLLEMLSDATTQLKIDENMTLDDLAATTPTTAVEEPSASPAVCLPDMDITLLSGDSVLMAGGEVSVQYSSVPDCDDDFIALHAVTGTTATTTTVGNVTPAYDAMEYISATATTASLSVACGGLFYISYNRTTTTIAGALVTRENHVLATTAPFSVSAAAVPATSSFTGSRTTIKTFTSFPYQVEYQPRLQKANICIIPSTSTTSAGTAARIQCWQIRETLIFEFDVTENSTTTSHFMKIPLVPELTYQNITTYVMDEAIVVNMTTSGILTTTTDPACVISALSCGFCGNMLSGDRLQVSELPSGVFEHMMDDCICASSEVPLSISELTPTATTALINDMILCVNSKDIIATVYDCKEASSLIDLMLHHSLYESQQQSATVVNIGTCNVACGRCYMSLGDAQFATTTTATPTVTSDKIIHDDIESLLLKRHAITAFGAPPITATQFICRYMQHTMRTYAVSCFLLQSQCSDRAMFLRVLTRDDYFISSNTATPAAAMRVSYRIVTSSTLLPKNSSKVLIDENEFDEVLAALENTKQYFSGTCFAGEKLAVLVR